MARKEINTICRLCLGEKVPLLHVFESEVIHGWTAADAIRELLEIQVSTRDAYPHFICTECVGKLVEFKQFKQQCEINRVSLEFEYSSNGEVGDNEDAVGMVFCGNENQSELFLKEEDVEVPIEKDPLDLSEEGDEDKAVMEDTFDNYNEVIGSADQVSVHIKCEFEDQPRTVDLLDHSGESNLTCIECTESFSSEIKLSRHMRIHCEKRPFKCYQCDKSFPWKSALNVHMRFHSGEKPYKCNQCIKSFSQKCHLVHHIRVHSGERPYKCNQCSKSFSQKSNLKVHMLFHSGIKPFHCNECNKSYYLKAHLKQHMMTHSRKRLLK